jgi:hypothetical protein
MSTSKECKDLVTFLRKLQSEETDDDSKAALKVQIDDAVQQYIDHVTTTKNTPSSSTSSDIFTPNSDKTYERGVKAISLALKDLPSYSGLNITETERYLGKLNQFFTLLVSEIDEKLESEFLMRIKLKLGDNV